MKNYYSETLLNKLVFIETLIILILTASYVLTMLLAINYIFVTDNPYLKQLKLIMTVNEKLNLCMKLLITYNHNFIILLVIIYILRYILNS
jgi:hypothetical protein